MELISRDEAENFLLEKAGLSGFAAMEESEIEKAIELGFDLFEETA